MQEEAGDGVKGERVSWEESLRVDVSGGCQEAMSSSHITSARCPQQGSMGMGTLEWKG